MSDRVRKDSRPLIDRMRSYHREPKGEALMQEAILEMERMARILRELGVHDG